MKKVLILALVLGIALAGAVTATPQNGDDVHLPSTIENQHSTDYRMEYYQREPNGTSLGEPTVVAAVSNTQERGYAELINGDVRYVNPVMAWYRSDGGDWRSSTRDRRNINVIRVPDRDDGYEVVERTDDVVVLRVTDTELEERLYQ